MAFHKPAGKVLVSACLAGDNVRFDGGNRLDGEIKNLVDSGEAIAACPEVLGGLGVPRSPCEIIGGDGHDVAAGCARVVTRDGRDVTVDFIRGARALLELAQASQCRRAVLKSKSPACGCEEIFDGTFSGKVKSGDGVATALLKAAGIEVISRG